MEKIIKIGDKSVKLNNNIAWTMFYRDQFGRDVVQDHVPVLATITETLAAIIPDADADGNVTVQDILESVEGRTLDLMLPLMSTEIMTTITNVLWAMAKAADEDIDPPREWVRQFDEFPLDVIIPTVYEMAMKGFISSKNWKRLEKMIKTLQPSHSTQLSSLDSNED